MSSSVASAVETPNLDGSEATSPTIDGAISPTGTSTGGGSTAPGLRLVGQQVGKYRVLREIGRGGMGAVFEAIHESIGQRIAIKVLNEEYSSDARHVQRFFDEMRREKSPSNKHRFAALGNV
jgi:serine/threonine protein kinase